MNPRLNVIQIILVLLSTTESEDRGGELSDILNKGFPY